MDHAPWEDPPRRPELQSGRLHLWLVTLSAEPGDPVRLRPVRAHAALKTILGAYLQEPPQDLRFTAGPAGKPHLDGLQFNLSHAGDLALVAVSKDRRVGVDIENLRESPAMMDVVSHIFTEEERGFVESHDKQHRTRAFFLIWNRREAAAKALGMDLLASFARLEVPVGACSTTGFLVPLTVEDWWLRDLSPAPGYVGALCLEGGPAELAWWRYRG